ncbi:MAG: UDP-N-acetylglucosamine--N-acetylmuramyl-(pentapeptide) pyrophosphoryl-undecaprenol N-acetylglucosamine transferase [Candidatus Zambryskibacteria bacterium]|nr:UDP-N-acetylglucosamine--N-acetylmuramyl-(pentapeptide) pyrophosphoryl-undecaprenol N-acetylglucosamine transferase [Candidatus Zambryskibacteria bacterium]
MKILFTGGGTGGHFYPIIAIVEELNQIVKQNHLLRPEIYYMSTEPYNEGLLFENNINFEPVNAGKIRRELSFFNLILNFFDLFKIVFGSLGALWRIFVIYPDVIFGKGGYASFPALLAARILRIPVVIHESDSSPGKVNNWAGKFARRVAISYPEAINFFKKDKVAYTGNPIRKEIQEPLTTGAYKLLGLNEGIPTILILGGSQGSVFINEIIMDSLPELIKKYQIIHQTGKKNIKVIEETRDVILQANPFKDRYKPFDYLNVLNLRASAGVADLIISRAGSTIFEIASWGKPSIIIPIPEPTSHDQKTNAYSYARSGAAIVIEEKNLASSLLVSEIDRIIETPGEKEKMAKCATDFARKDSAKLIAQEILSIALEHDK